MEQKPKLELNNNSVRGVMLTLGDTTRELDHETVFRIVQHLNQWLSWREHWTDEIEWYKDYSFSTIKTILDRQEEQFEEDDKEYRIGGEFSSYLGTPSKNGLMADNNQAEKIIENDWKEEFPEHKDDLVFDAEMSYCYIYTKKRDVAEKFMWWSYNKYKKPVIDLILNDINS